MAGAFDMAALERRVAALEQAHPASLRLGRVTEVCEKPEERGKVRVQMRDGQSVVTNKVGTLQRRVLKDQNIEMPDVGEPVVCLFGGQGCEDGFILGAYYSERELAPEDPPLTQRYRKCADGAEMYYDRDAHELKISLPAGARLLLECGPNKVEMDDAGIRISGPRIDLN